MGYTSDDNRISAVSSGNNSTVNNSYREWAQYFNIPSYRKPNTFNSAGATFVASTAPNENSLFGNGFA